VKGILEHSILAGGPFLTFGDIRPHAGKSYRVEGLPSIDRAGQGEPLGYSVSVAARALTIPDTFLDNDKYFWRIDYAEISLNLPLGEHPYIFNFDARHEQNKIFHYDITINFNVTVANLDTVLIVLNTLP